MEGSVWRDAKNKTRGAFAPRSSLAMRFSAREMLRPARGTHFSHHRGDQRCRARSV